jgi:hypothetical protein
MTYGAIALEDHRPLGDAFLADDQETLVKTPIEILAGEKDPLLEKRRTRRCGRCAQKDNDAEQDAREKTAVKSL